MKLCSPQGSVAFLAFLAHVCVGANASPQGPFQLDVLDASSNTVIGTSFVGLPDPWSNFEASDTIYPLRFPSSDPLACDEVTVADPVATGFVLAVERGICTFNTKVVNGRDAGAVAVLVLNTVEALYKNTSSVLPAHLLKNPCNVDCNKGKSTDKSTCESNPNCASKLCTNNPTTDFLGPDAVGTPGPYCCIIDDVFNRLALNGTEVKDDVYGSMVSIKGSSMISMLRTEKGDLGLAVQLSVRPNYAVDPGVILMFLLGTIVTAVAAYRATALDRYEALYEADESLPTDADNTATRHRRPPPVPLSDEEQIDISFTSAVVFLCVACGVLIGLFYLTISYPHEAVIGLNVLFMLGSINPVSFIILQPIIGRLFPSLKEKKRYVAALEGTVNGVEVLSTLLAMAFSITWFATRHSFAVFIYLDIASFAVACMFLSVIKLPSLRVGAILFGCFFVYDIFMVFISPLLFGGVSVMVQVATAGGASENVVDAPIPDNITINASEPIDFSDPNNLILAPVCARKIAERVPMLFLMPKFGWAGGEFVLLGLGDVFIPGLLVVLALRVDYSNVQRATIGAVHTFFSVHNYYLAVVFAYGAGLALTFAANILGWTVNGVRGQPALLYLCPFTLGAFAIVGWYKGQLSLIWGEAWNPKATTKTVADPTAQTQPKPVDTADSSQSGSDDNLNNNLSGEQDDNLSRSDDDVNSLEEGNNTQA